MFEWVQYFVKSGLLEQMTERIEALEKFNDLHIQSESKIHDDQKEQFAELGDKLQKCGVKWDFRLDEQMGFITELKENQNHWATLENVTVCRLGIESLEEVLRELKIFLKCHLVDEHDFSQDLAEEALEETVFKKLEGKDGEKEQIGEVLQDQNRKPSGESTSKPSKRCPKCGMIYGVFAISGKCPSCNEPISQAQRELTKAEQTIYNEVVSRTDAGSASARESLDRQTEEIAPSIKLWLDTFNYIAVAREDLERWLRLIAFMNSDNPDDYLVPISELKKGIEKYLSEKEEHDDL